MFRRWLPASLSMLIPPAKTGPDGRFQLRGAGRERIVSIVIQGARIETRVVQVMTRVGPSKSMRPPGPQRPLQTDILIYAIGFEHITAPGRDVEGDVVDAATGQPVPGVVIYPKMTFPGAFDVPNPLIRWRSEMSTRATTDARGHYRLGGLPVGRPVELVTGFGDQTPYRPMFQQLPNAPGVGPIRLDFKLVHGIPVEGKVTNRTTGKPVAAFVEYLPTLENPNLSSIQDVSLFEPIATRPDGRFTVSALPGPGVVVATVMDDRFLTADCAWADGPEQARQNRGYPRRHFTGTMPGARADQPGIDGEDIPMRPVARAGAQADGQDPRSRRKAAGSANQRRGVDRSDPGVLVAITATRRLSRNRPGRPSDSNSGDAS